MSLELKLKNKGNIMLRLIDKINTHELTQKEIQDAVERFNDEEVEVYDPHYGTSYMTSLILIKETGSGYSVAAVDKVGGIYHLNVKDNKLSINNSMCYGSRIGDKVEGWDFDRECTVAYGYESTCRYAEKAY